MNAMKGCFEREEWLTKTEMTGFFLSLSSQERSRGQQQASSTEEKSREDENNLEPEFVNRTATF